MPVLTDIENRPVVAKERVVWERWMGNLGSVDKKYSIYCRMDKQNKVLLYITENYSQYPVINHNGKECEKNVCVCVYIYTYIYN